MQKKGGMSRGTNMHSALLDYIEAHLKGEHQGELDNAVLAQIAGYSEYHFIRVFREAVHLTPADYTKQWFQSLAGCKRGSLVV